MYTGPAISTNGNHVHEIPDAIMGGHSYEIGKIMPVPKPQPIEAKITRFRVFKHEGKLCGICLVESPIGVRMLLATCLPLDLPELKVEDVMDVEQERVRPKGVITLGWDPWGGVKDLAGTVAKGAKAAGRGLMEVVQTPEFQRLALQAAPLALGAFGVPPQLTAKAMQMVNRAREGDPVALAKVRNINQLAQQGYPPAQQLYGVMSTYYRGGIPAVMQAPPQVPYMPQYPTPGWSGYPPQWAPPIPPGIQPFQIPTPGYGRGVVSGWYWNIPYRGVIQSKLTASPFDQVRAAYDRGMQ